MFERFGTDLILLERLAAGGMGEVYRAKQLGTAGFDKTVAVKRILPNYAALPDFNAMFQQEMRLCARLQHPNVAQVFATGEWQGYLYLVMEFLDGRTVRELIRNSQDNNNPIPPELCSLICCEVARGLSYAHSLRNDAGQPLHLVHRDISPQNIMIGYNGEVKILDFGVAKAADSMDLTKPGDLKGNLAYVSPEAVDALPLDGRADVFSLGAVAYELVTLHKLFGGQSTFETIKNIKDRSIPPMRSLRPDVPEEIERIVMKALTRRREDRYQAAEEVDRDLSLFLSKNFPGLVPADLGAFIASRFENERKRQEEERKNISEIFRRKSKTEDSSHNRDRRFGMGPAAPPFSPEGTVAGGPSETKHRFRWWRHAIALLLLAAVAAGFMIAPRLGRGPLARFSTERLTTGPVSAWNSESGTPVSLIQGDEKRRPVLAGKARPARIRFDGVDDFLSGDQLAPALSGAREFTLILAAGLHDMRRQTLWAFHLSDRDTDLVRLFLNQEGNVILKCSKTIGRDYHASTQQKIDRFSIYSTVVRPNEVQVFLNGRSIIKVPLSEPLDYGDVKFFSIGQDWDRGYSTDYLKGDIGDLLIFRHALGPDDRIVHERELAQRFNVSLAADSSSDPQ